MCELCGVFKKDEPFRFHRPDSNTKEVLVGKKAKDYISEFERIYTHAMNNSLMTAVIGQPGTGKTQLIHYIEGRSQKEKERVSIILELKDTRIDYEYLINYICSDKSINAYLNKYDYYLPSNKPPKELITNIGVGIEKIFNQIRNNNVGICLLVDAVDEYVRKINSTTGLIRGRVIGDLLGYFMFLLNDLPRLCVVFALTNDVYEEFKEALKEVSPGRRFLPVTDKNGDPIILEKLDETETKEMISTYLKIWSQRNNITLPIIENKDTNNALNTFPFTTEAINLFWRAGAVPGDTCIACLMALQNKITYSHKFKNSDHLIVTKSDAAWIIRRFSGYFVNYEKESGLKKEIESLLEGEQIDYELENIAMKAMQIYSRYSDAIIDAFESYATALGDEFRTQLGNRRKFIRDRFLIGNKYEVIDLIINFRSQNIGVQFILKGSRRDLMDKIYTLAIALKNKQIKNGLLILLSENREFFELAKKELERKKSEFEDVAYRKNYISTLIPTTIDENAAWYILGLHEFIQGDKIKMRRYSRHLDKKLKIYNLFNELIKKEPMSLGKRKEYKHTTDFEIG